MSLQEIYYIAEMVVGLAVIISIVFVAIELRQNTYMTRKSMAEERAGREDWIVRNMILNDEFRQFQFRAQTRWDELSDDEKLRATLLGADGLRPLLNELTAYFDNQISQSDYLHLEHNIRMLCKRPHVERAFKFLRVRYSDQVQNHYLKIAKDDRRILSLPEAALS